LNLQPLHIEKTDETPEVRLQLDAGPSLISGRSLPENAYEFYEPVINWIKSYSESSNAPFNLQLRFDYFNSSSGRYIFEILHILEQSRYKANFKITWIAEKEDDLMIEKGEELRSLSDLEFELVMA
jgi:hypothetical protein